MASSSSSLCAIVNKGRGSRFRPVAGRRQTMFLATLGTLILLLSVTPVSCTLNATSTSPSMSNSTILETTTAPSANPTTNENSTTFVPSLTLVPSAFSSSTFPSIKIPSESSGSPSSGPTLEPTFEPRYAWPSSKPTSAPTLEPTLEPTLKPTQTPSKGKKKTNSFITFLKVIGWFLLISFLGLICYVLYISRVHIYYGVLQSWQTWNTGRAIRRVQNFFLRLCCKRQRWRSDRYETVPPLNEIVFDDDDPQKLNELLLPSRG